MDNLNVKVTASPHVRSKTTTSDIMFDVILALVPASVVGIYNFGLSAAILIAVCIISSVLFEFLFEKGLGRKITIGDYSAVVTGLLIALNLPPTLPIWMAILGCAFGILVVKQLFGGLGQNFMNPALGARCFLLLSFTSRMTTFVYDGVTTATPLAVLKSTGDISQVSILDMFLGNTAGTIGETSAAALLIGALYLLVKRVISPRIPLIYIGTFAISIAIYACTKDYNVVDFTLAHVCGGGLMLGAWFMATDYVTSPITPMGKVIFGVMLGLLTFVLRIFGGSAEGVSYAIIISNLFVPLIEKVTVPKSFGEGAEKGAGNGQQVDKKGIVNAIIAIFAITAIMGCALGVVYAVTKKPIEDAALKAKQEAYAMVFAEASNVVEVENIDYDSINDMIHSHGYTSDTINEVNNVLDNNDNVIGCIVVVTNSDGYGGDIQMTLGVASDGTVKGLEFLSIGETVGLGMNAKNDEFKSQFVGKNVSEFVYTKNGATEKNEIDALSGATITTSAVTDGVNAALKVAIDMIGGALDE